MSLVTLTIEKQVAYVCLNRPEKLNAINFEMFLAIDRVITQLKRRRDVRAVIVHGAEHNFSAGLDIASVMRRPSQALRLLVKWRPGAANLAQRVSLGWQRLAMPVVAVIEGNCLGGGMQIALGADFRIASPECRLSIMEAKWGLVPDMAGLAMLRTLVPKDKALELTMTANIITATEAHHLGLVSRVSPEPMDCAITLIEQLTEHSPDALAAIKFSTHRSWSASLSRLLGRETWYQLKLLLGRNQKIATQRQTKQPQLPYKPRQKW
ncbi:crotonase/enoyl-CoA hydratase family protein [Shewanella sp. NIFS-20-20]|uniref:crotonase/enoyl-CoA hydratase family protein n=1 Tax=Shewanella sp. NIFS-20-20 TaxID=2853806 RepID=UPI001C4734EC|nr:crotonase/enoyl-CoA hydratase family protein [Shewanella sp. NIFS-20-20]MBV7316201.1 crotonase/enoyl-CoA hydratase family protein [Shewanella sp. NIFS-20-20]